MSGVLQSITNLHSTRDGLADHCAITISFRVTEQPHKTGLTAALIGFLYLSPGNRSKNPVESEDHAVNGGDSDAKESSSNVGLYLVTDLIATFRNDLDARLWRNVRLLLHLFASLLPLRIISASSLRAILTSFAAVLDEPGVAAARGDRAALCVVETICRAGRDLVLDNDAESEEARALQQLDELVDKVERYASEYRQTEVELVRPIGLRAADAGEAEEDWLHEQSFDTLVHAARMLRSRAYERPAFLPSPQDLLPPPVVAHASASASSEKRINLPYVLVPPEDEFADGAAPSGPSLGINDPGMQRGRQAQGRSKKGAKIDDESAYRAGAGFDRVSRYPKWFKETVPDPQTPEAVVIRSLVDDIIDLYQVNRKEAARILFDLPRWLRKGTFVSKAVPQDRGLFGEPDDTWQVSPEGYSFGGWSLEELVVESILSTNFVLPTPPQKPLYYMSLLREIVTLSPQSIAPAMGKSVRRIYNIAGTGRVDGEALRRFADWFSVHLSNFNFSWNWKEWIPDMSLPSAHPKLAFARRIIELEIRLAYHERIKTSLPPEVQGRLLAAEEPGPVFTYGVETHPYRDRALEFIQSMRARATAEVILANLQTFKKDITPEVSPAFLPSSDDTDAGHVKVLNETEADMVIRDVVIQTLLSIGSRSFSHFLNVVERYHTLLRQLSTTPATRIAILASTARFWMNSPQWIIMIFDKWLQYRIVEPTDVVEFVFHPPKDQPALVVGADASAGSLDAAAVRDWSNFTWSEIIKLTVFKVHGRVDQVRKRLETLQREETEREERLEAVRESGGAIEDPKSADGQAEAKMPLFPSGATQSTLPRRPDLPSEAVGTDAAQQQQQAQQQQRPGGEKKQTVAEARVSYETITQEQRKVLVSTLSGFVTLLRQANSSASGPKVWHRTAQDDNDEATWQAWWLKCWYIEYCRLFAKDLAANHETMAANVFAGAARGGSTDAAADPVYDVFDRCSQMATE